ncbi:hypothetical protein EI427_11990 [Flammeovirga pectinis]|uniref:SMP-30/Gluconolactonase/LRE-like region domain-containing protein n=1 Tax=Flammeovirga pectinis TaxID=2494373 RepID=A0A3Q9FRP5_9BACT|nr:hypothetical protein [Flammeovirga pectinis]AZQ62932.1 hypothetical protein EI427_11990 [Flammeovirga pectinis]
MYKIIFSFFFCLTLTSTVFAQKEEGKKKKNKKTITADPNAKLIKPTDVAFDEKSGLFYISSPGNHGIIKRGRRGGAVFAVKDLLHPRGLTTYGGILYVADSNRVVGYQLKTSKKVFEENIDGANALHSIACDGSHLFVSDKSVSKIFKITIKSKKQEILTADIVNPTGLYYDKKLREILILSSQESGGGVYTYNLRNKEIELRLTVDEFPYLEDITFNESMSYYITAWGADHKENVIIKINSSLKREARVIQSSTDGPSGLLYIKRTNELAIASEYSNNLNIIKLGY